MPSDDRGKRVLLSWLLPKKSRSLQAGSRAFPGLVGGGFVRPRPLPAKRESHMACLLNPHQLVGAAVELGGGVRVQRLPGDPGPLGSRALPPTLSAPGPCPQATPRFLPTAVQTHGLSGKTSGRPDSWPRVLNLAAKKGPGAVGAKLSVTWAVW